MTIRPDKVLAILMGLIVLFAILAVGSLAVDLQRVTRERDQARDEVKSLQEANSESASRFQACLSIARKQNRFLMDALGAAVPALPENSLIACSIVRIPDHVPAGGPAQ